MQKVTPFLMYDGDLGEVLDFYSSVFKDDLKTETRGHQDESLQSAEFEIGDQKFMAFNGGPHFKFSEAISLFVSCEDQAEVDYFWEKLTADGGEESMCGWLKDKFGVSWQIVPKGFTDLVGSEDREKAGRAVQAMMGMRKLNLAELKKAYEGA